MDKRHTVKLTTSSSFELEHQEIKQIYIRLSLFHHRYMRIPNYPERPLIEALEKDFKKFYLEMSKQTELAPNNLTLNKIRTFFEIHSKYLKGIVEEYKEQEVNADNAGNDNNAINPKPHTSLRPTSRNLQASLVLCFHY